MTRVAALALGVFAAGCSLQTYAIIQPRFRTQEAATAFERVVQAVDAHCGGVESSNPEARVVIGRWQLWSAADGASVSQCIVTVFSDESGSAHLGEVRVTFSVRKCPLSDVSDVEALAPTCERTDVVTQLVSTELSVIAQRLEADVRR
ncbi:MAG: hypothetical protein IT380_18785 [Myxococcales bacterium]|nr:hypothetical protein [Myxococcales bacterium]